MLASNNSARHLWWSTPHRQIDQESKPIRRLGCLSQGEIEAAVINWKGKVANSARKVINGKAQELKLHAFSDLVREEVWKRKGVALQKAADDWKSISRASWKVNPGEIRIRGGNQKNDIKTKKYRGGKLPESDIISCVSADGGGHSPWLSSLQVQWAT